MSEDEAFCCAITAGLLGAKIDRALVVAGGGKVIVDARLEEAERRIIELESLVQRLCDIVQP